MYDRNQELGQVHKELRHFSKKSTTFLKIYHNLFYLLIKNFKQVFDANFVRKSYNKKGIYLRPSSKNNLFKVNKKKSLQNTWWSIFFTIKKVSITGASPQILRNFQEQPMSS